MRLTLELHTEEVFALVLALLALACANYALSTNALLALGVIMFFAKTKLPNGFTINCCSRRTPHANR